MIEEGQKAFDVRFVNIVEAPVEDFNERAFIVKYPKYPIAVLRIFLYCGDGF